MLPTHITNSQQDAHLLKVLNYVVDRSKSYKIYTTTKSLATIPIATAIGGLTTLAIDLTITGGLVTALSTIAAWKLRKGLKSAKIELSLTPELLPHPSQELPSLLIDRVF